MSVSEISEQEFDHQVLRSALPVLVEFMSAGERGCQTVAPEVDKVAREVQGSASVVKVDIDRSRRIAATYHIQSVPTFMVFQGGRSVAATSGVLRHNQLKELLDPFIPGE